MAQDQTTLTQDDFGALKQDAPIPGEAFTGAPKTLPFEKPSQFTSVEEYLEVIFERMTQPRQAAQFLALVDSGIELDLVIASLVQSMFGEGQINANMVFLVVPPLTIMLMRMAEAAGIEPKVSSDPNKMETPEILYKLKGAAISGNQVSKATKAAKTSSSQLSDLPKKGGLMKRISGVV